MSKNQREIIRRSALECLEQYELIIERIKDLCADFDSGRRADIGSMALQLRLLFIDSSARSGGRSVMNLLGISQSLVSGRWQVAAMTKKRQKSTQLVTLYVNNVMRYYT